jgi:hypothetical protein
MFRDRRQDPGLVSVTGHAVSSNWLAAAATPQGAAIPAQIANKLRDREFSSFRAFRKAFWKAVANDQPLAAQFTKINIADMKNGLSPSSDIEDHIGKRKKTRNTPCYSNKRGRRCL